MALEAAIPRHLQQERTVPAKTPHNYQPPFPAYSARFPRDAKELVVVVVGMQFQQASHNVQLARSQLLRFFQLPFESAGPRYWVPATATDREGCSNECVIAYWLTKRAYDDWAERSGIEKWWRGLEPDPEIGWFREILLPSVDRFETVFSDNDVPEGAANMRESVSGQIQEHVYWGSMRDRLPAAQTDLLESGKSLVSGDLKSDTRNQRIQVPGWQNLAIIRSGQDWSDTTPHERKLYLETMHPVLIKGMEFLRDRGEEVGCFDCRFMTVRDVDSPSNQIDKTFGLAYFDHLGSLESWSREHKTHLDIFGRFLQYAGELEGNVSLRLFHEVYVVETSQQSFEYVGCHRHTGMLKSLQ